MNLLRALGTALILFLTGIVWFRRLERTFVDTMG